MKRIFPPSFYNIITLIGAAVSGVTFGLILFLILIETMAAQPKPYMGIVTFVILPVFLLLGIAVMIFGIAREHHREKIGKPHSPRLPQIDLNNPRHRTAFVTFSVGGVLLLLFSAFGSFKAYEYTDSDQFCGETCHTVMEPEYTAYQFSPHAKVGCVQCHIGSGADWFVRAKISGSYQLYAVAVNNYPKPIPTPIENLRPAQETCEQCHWPKHFFSEKLEVNTYYLADERNTKWDIDLLMKVGGGNIEAGPTSGIHWHMNIAHEVTYKALDRERQVIPWVRSRNPEGVETIYRSTEVDVDDDSLGRAFTRRMDCIDCHNRPTHIYRPPAPSVNHLMSLGWISPSLPSIKSVSVEALEGEYSTKPGALDTIGLKMEEYYRENHPEVLSTMRTELDSAIGEVRKIYRRNYFPEMRTDWKKFPDNIGHLYYNGCFRCHDGKHQTAEGKVLSKDCNTCHTILAQKFENDSLRMSLGGIQYRHPVDIGDAWMEMNCSECHSASGL
jgi:hypothetical protein